MCAVGGHVRSVTTFPVSLYWDTLRVKMVIGYFFYPGDDVMLRVIGYRPGHGDFAPRLCHDVRLKFTKPSESSVMSIIIRNKCNACLYLNR